MRFNKNGDYIIVCRSEKEIRMVLENFKNVIFSSPDRIWTEANRMPIGFRMTNGCIMCRDWLSWYERHAEERFPEHEFIEAKRILSHKILRRI